ncbi:MAG: hypothetical protein HY736_26030 [Verrucomicrobia bacterium]|nr:hypothetical protein [Verrucomicrobiota bacterium]
MKRATSILLAVALALVAGVAWWWTAPRRTVAPAMPPSAADPARAQGGPRRPGTATVPSSRPRQTENLSPEEKAAQIGRIKRDYDDIRAKASADYTAAAAAFPGGLNAFLRQLALLEREKRLDFAAVLTPRELEDLEVRETTAGQLVQRLLGDTSATEEQQRAVFRVQQEFEDRFALTFDTAPGALLERERARCETQEKIRAELGDELFAAWLRGEGPEFGHFTTFVTQQGLPAAAAVELWRAKNEFTIRRLEVAAQRTFTVEQLRAAHANVARQTEARVLAILGAGAMQAAGHEVLGWLPRK